MDETPIPENTASNVLFAFLGGVCAIIVGIAIFQPDTLRTPGSRAPSSEGGQVVPESDPRTDLPILD